MKAVLISDDLYDYMAEYAEAINKSVERMIVEKVAVMHKFSGNPHPTEKEVRQYNKNVDHLDIKHCPYCGYQIEEFSTVIQLHPDGACPHCAAKALKDFGA